MDALTIHDIPERRLPYMIAAFAGWGGRCGSNDEGPSASSIARSKRIRSPRFRPRTSTTLRPLGPKRCWTTRVSGTSPGPPTTSMPTFPTTARPDCSSSPASSPTSSGKTYCDTIIAVADRYGVELMVTLGSLFNTVPHTRPFPVSSVVSSQQDLGERVQAIGAFNSPYQGPTAVHTVLSDFCRQRGLDHVSLWGHGPHYLPSMPNPKLSYTLLDKVRRLLDVDLELEDLRRAGDRFEQKATESIANNEEIVEYVRRLEEAFDASQAPKPLPDDVPTPDEVIRDLEEFLKSERNRFDSD